MEHSLGRTNTGVIGKVCKVDRALNAFSYVSVVPLIQLIKLVSDSNSFIFLVFNNVRNNVQKGFITLFLVS